MIGVIAVVLAIGGIILSLLYKHYQHAICYFLIAAVTFIYKQKIALLYG